MVYRLLQSLNARASTIEIISSVKERYPNLPLHVHVREQLDELEAKGYVVRDKSRLPYMWVVTKKKEKTAT